MDFDKARPATGWPCGTKPLTGKKPSFTRPSEEKPVARKVEITFVEKPPARKPEAKFPKIEREICGYIYTLF